MRGASVTELELYHGHLNCPGKIPAIVSFRDKKFDDLMHQMHKERAVNYCVEDDDARRKLLQLRHKVQDVRDKALAVYIDYSNPYEGARLMYQSIIKYLEDNVLKQSAEMTRRDVDFAPHNAFAASCRSLYINISEYDNYLNQVLQDLEDGNSPECPHVLVLGPAGIGKSSLLCSWVHHHVPQHENLVAISYYVGCASNTTDPEELLSFIDGELDYLFEVKIQSEMTQTHRNMNFNKNKDSIPDVSMQHTQISNVQSTTVDSYGSSAPTYNNNGLNSTFTGSVYPSCNKVNTSVDVSLSSKTDISGDSIQSNPSTSTHVSQKASNQQINHSAVETAIDKSLDKSERASSLSDPSLDKRKETPRPKGKELQHQIVKKLQNLTGMGKRVVLVLDGVNRLIPKSKTSKPLYWLPENERLPKGVLFIVSTTDNDEATVDILQKQRGYRVLRLEPLDDICQQKICVETLKRSGKELSPLQLQRIVRAEQTSNPLFLKIVLAELSVFGNFRELDAKIDSLISAAGVKELLHNLLERLESDYNLATYHGNLVGEILQALYLAEKGLTESEIISMFHIESSTWSLLFFALEHFIVSNQGLMGFSFMEVKEAVKERYLKNIEAEYKARRKLIAYFDRVRSTIEPWAENSRLDENQNKHAIFEVVWQQRKVEDKDSLTHTLSDLAVFRTMNIYYELDLLELWSWTQIKWKEVVTLLLKEFDLAIVRCYQAIQDGLLDSDKTPGHKLLTALAQMRNFFELVSNMDAKEKVIEREIQILEKACHTMAENKRREYLHDARYYLACTYASQDHYKKARALHESNLTEFKSALEETPGDVQLQKVTAYTHNGLGLLFMAENNYHKAIEYISLSAEQHKISGDHKNEGSCYINLALCFMYLKRYKEALEISQKALEAYEDGEFGQIGMEVGNIYTNMGLIFRHMKNLDRAEEAYMKSLQIKANAVGWDHPVIATAFMNLGTLEMHRKNYSKAEEWTRKAIAVYQSNDYEVTKKEYRRCRENLFANMLKQKKFEEVLPLYIEIFDILKSNGWLDECLGGMHRQMVAFIIDEHQELLHKAEEVCKAMIDSPKAHPDNYLHLVTIDRIRHSNHAEIVQEQNKPYSLDCCMERFPNHHLYPQVVETKLKIFLFPRDDIEGLKHVLRSVAEVNSHKLDEIIHILWTTADHENKTELLFHCLKASLDEDLNKKELLRLFLKSCICLAREVEAIPYLDAIFSSLNGRIDDFNPEALLIHLDSYSAIFDVGKILLVKGDIVAARKVLLNISQCSWDPSCQKEAQEMLDSLQEDPPVREVGKET